ncbi:Matrix metalloproteinase-25 [Bagarius yarrelli]|uniref:Matrix metalloproteinase-25 n=1 Tax=Bagarius yarrelli TaxID=175774 RepID=A0A556TIF6_BAGYA|nr:Matrix metalloproteinase-25 [Bagarius yarrelli]
MEHFTVLYLSSAVIALASPGTAAPSPDLYSRGIDWLSRYGYLPPPDPRTGTLQTKEGLEISCSGFNRCRGSQAWRRPETTDKCWTDANTLKQMSMPRCSLPDIVGSEYMLRKKRYALAGSSWEKNNLRWSILSYPRLYSSLSPDLVDRLMFYALKVWSDNTNLQFHSVSNDQANSAEIRISFARSLHDDGYPFDGKGGTLAHAFFPGQADINGDTHFDDEETWTYGQPDGVGTDLFTVAVHEFGHALGLSHSSANPSIMRPYYQGPVGDISQYTLPMDDLLAIQTLYGIKANKETTPPNGHSTPRMPEPPSTPSSPRGTVPPSRGYPDRCDGGFDAVANIRGDVFFFKGTYFWRMQRSGTMVSLSPALIKNFWIGLPPGTEKIDAVYERKTDGHIIFFIGSQFWIFKDTVALPGYPRPLSEWGMRKSDGRIVERVDAAFIWAHNGHTYLFSGDEFWRFTENQAQTVPRPDMGYPRRSTSLWKGVPSIPDDIMSWGKAGDTFFFKGNSYWVIKSGEMDQDSVKPKSTATDWMFCPIPSPTPAINPRCGKCRCAVNKAGPLNGPSISLMLLLFQCISILNLTRLIV